MPQAIDRHHIDGDNNNNDNDNNDNNNNNNDDDTSRKFEAMLLMTTTFALVELIVGYVSNSMALVADSFHMLSDASSLVVALVGLKLASKRWPASSFGWARAELLGALINSVSLLALCLSILVESTRRFIRPATIREPHLLLITGAVGLFINLVGVALFWEGHQQHGHQHGPTRANHHSHSHGHSHAHATSGQMNVRAVFLHLLADALGSVVVIISALVVLAANEHLFGDYWRPKMAAYVDPALSIVVASLIIGSTWPLLCESALTLLQTAPSTRRLPPVDSLRRRLPLEVPGVVGVRQLHVWQLTGGDQIVISIHIELERLDDMQRLVHQVKQWFEQNFAIQRITIEPVFVRP